MKIAVIGGGSTYTPELVKGFLDHAGRVPLTELWLMDTDPARLEIVAAFATRMVNARGDPFKIVPCLDLQAAIRGASYVITQFRVGQMPARVADEYLGRRHGLVGQETTGIGGMAKALRTIPVALEVARAMQALAPGAWLLNFTNPSGLVTEALQRHAPGVPSVGVCNSGITTRMEILKAIKELLGEEIAPERAVLLTLGLNHLTWHRGFLVDGLDLWGQLFPAYLEKLRQAEHPHWDVRTLESLGMLPNDYLQYFYYTETKVAEQANWPPSRGEQVLKIEERLLGQYADPALVEPPADLMLRGGAWYSTLAVRLIDSLVNDLDYVEVVNVRNQGTIRDWPPDWVLEMPCRINSQGIQPLAAEPLPPVCFGLLAQVKAYELLTVEAAVYGDRRSAYQALLAHPLGPRADKVQQVLDDLLQVNRAYLPQFFKDRP